MTTDWREGRSSLLSPKLKEAQSIAAGRKMSISSDTLSRFFLFVELDEETRQEVSAYAQERTFESGQIMMFAGEPCQGVYLICEGYVIARRLSLEGREYVLDYRGPGDCINVVPVLDGGTNLATVEALSDTTIYLIPCARFHQILRAHNTVAIAVLDRLAHRVRRLSDTVEDLALHTVRTRLARFLLSRESAGAYPSRRWTQEEIAAHVGTVRDVIGRTLRSFSQEGLVRRERGRLIVTDRGKLAHAAMQE